MVMHSGNTDFNAKRMPLVQAVQQMDATKELIRSSKTDDFITVLNFLDQQEATDFAQCLYKCRKYGLKNLEERFWFIAKARVAVKGRRSEMYAQTLARLLVPEFFGGNKVNNGNNRKDGEPVSANNN
jgi:hypothetical protein